MSPGTDGTVNTDAATSAFVARGTAARRADLLPEPPPYLDAIQAAQWRSGWYGEDARLNREGKAR